MRVFHISSDFGATEVYKNLYRHLDTLGIIQVVFVPLNPRGLSQKGNHDFEFKTNGSKIIYSEVQKWYHRYLYSNKISEVVKDAYRLIDFDSIDLIHTGTLAMTGAIAYELHKRNNIPYIVSVRNTDINIYLKKMWWKKSYFNQILINSSAVIFISPQYKQDCFSVHFDKTVVDKIKYKTKVIPNGIDKYFLRKKPEVTKKLHSAVDVVYAGGFGDNKNLIRLIKAIDILKKYKVNIKLTAIGEGLPNRKVNDKYLNELYKITENKPYIQLRKYMRKDRLCEDYTKRNIFAMPSIHETFGLSYVEALSQGLPIIYTKGQGFDGFYEDGFIGKSVNAVNVGDIVKGIEYIIENYDTLAGNVAKLDLDKDFNWINIAAKYKGLYEKILRDK